MAAAEQNKKDGSDRERGGAQASECQQLAPARGSSFSPPQCKGKREIRSRPRRFKDKIKFVFLGHHRPHVSLFFVPRTPFARARRSHTTRRAQHTPSTTHSTQHTAHTTHHHSPITTTHLADDARQVSLVPGAQRQRAVRRAAVRDVEVLAVVVFCSWLLVRVCV